MAAEYQVKCASGKSESGVIYTFPDGFRIREFELRNREDTVVVPGADGVKDVSDSKLDATYLVVGGTVRGSTAFSVESTIDTMENTLIGEETFYVYRYKAGSNIRYYYVNKVVSIRWSPVDLSGGTRAEVEVTFACYSPSFGT